VPGSIDSSTIKVHADLADAGPHIATVSETISEELASLIRLLEPLQETWTGAAATYYEGLQAEWNTAANGLFGPDGVLGQISRALGVNWANYSDAEWANVQTWQH
jgi:WXG100 family type VII secretion target